MFTMLSLLFTNYSRLNAQSGNCEDEHLYERFCRRICEIKHFCHDPWGPPRCLFLSVSAEPLSHQIGVRYFGMWKKYQQGHKIKSDSSENTKKKGKEKQVPKVYMTHATFVFFLEI